MYRKIWKQCHSSVCSIHYLSKSGTRITTFTGFKVRNLLITDDIIHKFTAPEEVLLRFAREDGQTESASVRLGFREFTRRIVLNNAGGGPGYAIIDIGFEEFRNIPSLPCSQKINYEIGHPIAILGYQLEQNNLALKSGIISSLFNEPDGLNYIQVDCSVKQGNAGGPVIDVETMQVIGVIGHRLAYIARSYQEMMRIINNNLKLLKDAEGKFSFDDIDPVQVLMVNQNQIKHLATEFFKSANMRVGFAVELCSLADYCSDPEDVSSVDLETNIDD